MAINEKRIQLVNAPLSQNYIASSKAGAYPPLNLLTLATYIQERLPGIHIEIVDGEIVPFDRIIAEINADIVGISAGILSYETAVQIAEAAAQNGSKVIMGGAYPTAISHLILNNRPFVDAVVLGDGEESLFQYILSPDLNTVPNLAYRKNGDIVFTKKAISQMDAVPVTNYKFIDLSPYFNNFQKNYPTKPFDRTLPVFSSKGCLWRDISGGCIYCALPTYGYRAKSPQSFWREVGELHNKYNVSYIWDVSDTFTRPLYRLREIAQHKPDKIDVSFLLYGRYDDIDDFVASLLSAIGAYEIFIGIESGDDNILNTANRGQISSGALVAVNALAKYGVKTLISFQIGLPGENEKSCESSLRLAKKLAETGNVAEVFSSMLLPIPGARAFHMLMRHEDMQRKYHGLDILPLEDLRRDFVKKFCYVSYEYIAQVRDEIMALFPLSSSLGKPKKEFAK